MELPNFDEPATFESFLLDFFGGPIIDLQNLPTYNYADLLIQHKN